MNMVKVLKEIKSIALKEIVEDLNKIVEDVRNSW